MASIIALLEKMKKIAFLLFLSSFIIVGIKLHGQTSKLVLGSSIDIFGKYSLVGLRSDLLFDIDFSIGMKTKNRFIWGLRPEYSLREIYLWRWDPNQGKYVTITNDANVLGAGLFGRFFLPIGSKWRFLIDLNIAYNYTFAKESSSSTGGHFVGNYGGGFSYFLNKKLALELLLTLNAEDITFVEPFGFSDEQHSIRLGIQYFLNP